MNAVAHVTKVTFEVTNTLVVSDPCYLTMNPLDDPGLTAAAPGSWAGEIEYEKVELGTLVSTLRLHRGVMPLELRRIGAVGVDSGRMYAGCLSDLPLDYEEFLVCSADQGYPDCMAFGGGIVCASGFGDGVYPVYADRDFTVVEVRFLEAA